MATGEGLSAGSQDKQDNLSDIIYIDNERPTGSEAGFSTDMCTGFGLKATE